MLLDYFHNKLENIINKLNAVCMIFLLSFEIEERIVLFPGIYVKGTPTIH